MIYEAEKSIYIQTPYFIPDQSMLEALKIAARSGVEVKIMIPDRGDHPFVYAANNSFVGELLDAGARCYRYKINAFIYDRERARYHNQIFAEDLENSEEITREIFENRGWTMKLRESVSRLLSPIL
jgi:cardiolipin synthase